MSIRSEPWLETSLCSSRRWLCSSLAVFGVMPASLRDKPSSCPQLVCCHIFPLHVASTSNRTGELILFHTSSTAMKSVIINTVYNVGLASPPFCPSSAAAPKARCLPSHGALWPCTISSCWNMPGREQPRAWCEIRNQPEAQQCSSCWTEADICLWTQTATLAAGSGA